MSDYLLAPRLSVTKQKTLKHFESRANAPWISKRKRKRNLKNCSELSESVETVQPLWEGKKSPRPAPWDRPCFNAKVNDRPVSDINKEQLSCALFSLPLSHTDRSLTLLGLVLLYLGLSTFLHFFKRAPNYVILVFKLLIKITYLIYF